MAPRKAVVQLPPALEGETITIKNDTNVPLEITQAVEAEVALPTDDTEPEVAAKKKKATIQVIMDKLKRTAPKNYEFDISRTTTSVFSRVKYVLKSGIAPVDMLTGGIPFGRTTEIYGLEGCLKTGLMVHLCGAANDKQIYEVESWEKEGKFKLLEEEIEVSVLYIDNETSLEDNDRLIVRGKKVDMLMSDADTIDMIFKQIETVIDSLEEIEQASIKAAKEDKSKKTKVTKQFLVVVVDTIASTASAQEMEEDWGKQDYPRQAQQIKKAFRKLNRRINARNVALICANQVGDSFAPKAMTKGNKFALPQEADFATPGGKALKYFASLRIFMVNANPNYKVFQASKFPDGQVTQLYTTKNRQLKPRRTARLALLYRSGLSDEYSILEHFIHFKMATYNAAGAIVFNFSKYGIKPELNLQDADMSGEKYEVEVTHKQFWPEVYQANKTAFDQLLEKARQIMYETDTEDFVAAEGEDDDDDVLAKIHAEN